MKHPPIKVVGVLSRITVADTTEDTNPKSPKKKRPTPIAKGQEKSAVGT